MFQSNAFQSNGYQSLFGEQAAPPTPDTRDLGSYESYRKRLKRIVKISEEREKSKYKIAVNALVKEEIVKEDMIAASAVANIVEFIKAPEPDYAMIQRQAEIALMRMEKILAYYVRMEEYKRLALKKRQNQDALIILLSML